MRHYDKITLSFSMGMIGSITKDAVDLAAKHDCLVEFVFNGVTVTVSQFSDVGKVCEDTLKKVKSGA